MTEKEKTVQEEVSNITGEDVPDDKVLAKQAPLPSVTTQMNQPSSVGASIGKSLFTSVTLSKSGGACAVKPQKQDKDVIWASGKSSPEKLREEPEGEYVPEGWSPKGEKEDDKKKKSVKKSIIERRYGSQLARTYDIGKSCGVCGRVSKSCNDNNGCCEDCKKSMNITLWHDSHLS